MTETFSIHCAHCDHKVAAEVILGSPHAGAAGWLRCPLCGEGTVVGSGNRGVYPRPPAGSAIEGLPEDVRRAWMEARSAHGVGAFTAAEIMCRKILMHVAVDVAHSKSGKSFLEYVDALETAGYITTGLKPVIDKIRARGNVANHQLLASAEQESLTTLSITEHLLRSVYELPGLAEDTEGGLDP